MYVIRRLRMVNFISHEDTTIEFDRGVTAIVGPNGAGKSSIVDAIYYALTGRTDLRGTKENLVRRGAAGAEGLVDLVLEDAGGGGALRIYRPISAKGSRPPILYVGGRREASGVEAVRRRLKELMGLEVGDRGPRALLGMLAVVRQGGLSTVISNLSSPTNLRKYMEDVLGVTGYKEAAEKLKELSVAVGDESLGFKASASRTSLRLAEAARRKAEEELARRRRELEGLQARLARVEEELAEARRRVEELQRLEREHAAARATLEGLEERLAATRGELETLKARLRELEAAASSLPALEAEVGRLERIASLAPLIVRALEASERAARLGEEVGRLEQALAALEALERVRGSEERLREVVKLVDEAASRLALASRRAASAEKELREAESRLSRFKVLASRASRLAGVSFEDAGLEGLREALERLRREAEKLKAEASEARARARALEEKAAELEEKARLLRGSAEGGRCPLCGSPLPPGRAAEIAERLRREAEEALDEAERLIAEAKAKESRASKLESTASRLAEILAAMEALAPPSPEELAGLREEYEAARREAMEAQRLLDQLRGEREKLGRLAVEEARARSALGTLGFDPDSPGLRGELEGRLKKARAELEEALGEAREAARPLLQATGARDVEEAARVVGEASERLREARARLEEARRAASEYQALKVVVEDRERLLEALEREAEAARARLREIEEGLRELERARREAEELEEEARRLGRRVEAARALVEEARRRLEAAEEALWKTQVLLYIRDIFEKRMPSRLMSVMLRAVGEAASDFLSRFNLDYVGLNLSPSGDGVQATVLARDGAQVPVTQLSGGEKTSVAIAFLLGLNRVLSSRIGFLVLDEPTAEMDEERRRALIDVIRSFAGGRGIPQLIVVTHNDDVAEAADTICRVSKQGRSSRVACGG